MWRKLGRQVYEYFDSIVLRWSSIDPVRFAEVGSPLFLWVGVMPSTLPQGRPGCGRALQANSRRGSDHRRRDRIPRVAWRADSLTCRVDLSHFFPLPLSRN
jgi:hypothetical protein